MPATHKEERMALHKISDREEFAGGAGAVNARGWDVRTRVDDEDVGKVKDVLVEDTGEARYLDVDLGVFRKRVLLPVERVTTDSSEEVVWVDSFDKDGFERIPEYDGDIAKLNADYQAGLLRDYSAAEASMATPTGAGAYTGRDRDDDAAERAEDIRTASPAGDSRLARVGELSDYEVADHHPDVRGWDVVASDDRKIGDVKDLIADTGAMTVRYLDIELDSDYRRSDDESRVLVPIDQVRLIEDDDKVRLDALASHQARDIPTHRGTFDREYEGRVTGMFPPDTMRDPTMRDPTNPGR
jgi:sporulation protein YlmC with PRC-barrel domain